MCISASWVQRKVGPINLDLLPWSPSLTVQYLVFTRTWTFLLAVIHQPQDGASPALFTQSLQTQALLLCILKICPCRGNPLSFPVQCSSPELCRVAKLLTPAGLVRKVSLVNSPHYAAVSISNEILLLQGISLKHVIKQIKMSNSNESH